MKYAATKEAALKKDEGQSAMEEIVLNAGNSERTVSAKEQVTRVIQFIRRDLEEVMVEDSRVDLLREELDALQMRADNGEEILEKEIQELVKQADKLQSMDGYDLWRAELWC